MRPFPNGIAFTLLFYSSLPPKVGTKNFFLRISVTSLGVVCICVLQGNVIDGMGRHRETKWQSAVN